MKRRFFAVPYEEVINSNGKLTKEFKKFLDSSNASVSLYHDAYDKLIAEVLTAPAELYFTDGDKLFEEDIISVLGSIWENKELFGYIRKLLQHQLFACIKEYEDKLNN